MVQVPAWDSIFKTRQQARPCGLESGHPWPSTVLKTLLQPAPQSVANIRSAWGVWRDEPPKTVERQGWRDRALHGCIYGRVLGGLSLHATFSES